MWVQRSPVLGGFMYKVYGAPFVDALVSQQGHTYLRNIGWHAETNCFVSASDDWILRRHGLISLTRRVGASSGSSASGTAACGSSEPSWTPM